MPIRPRRVVGRNRLAERDGPDPEQATRECPTKVRIQLSFQNARTAAYDVWRGAAIKVVAADAAEAMELYETVKRAALAWWESKNT